MNGEQIAECVNTLGEFCGKRDISELTQSVLYKKYGVMQADIMVLFGGSILCGGDVLAEAMKNNVAKKYMIVGGAGHTTETLRQIVQQQCPEMKTAHLAEADIFAHYLRHKYGLTPDYLERNSTNCGNNVTYCLDFLKEQGYSFKNMIIVQDATMQRRMEAGFLKYLPEDVTIINYAAYKVEVAFEGGQLRYKNDVLGMWDIERYMSLLMGEIPRLSDDEEGYGPRGKGYIAHVAIPNKVLEAFDDLKEAFHGLVRDANPQYASSINMNNLETIERAAIKE